MGVISIHALRVEGDYRAGRLPVQRGHISIHALRVEGDDISRNYRLGGFYFYPRPPGGGRRCF